MRRIISVLLENEPGALSRVVGLFSQRGYNIETLNVAPTEDPTLSRLTLTHRKKSATGDVALKITTKGGWRSALKRRAVLQYITSFLNTEPPVKRFFQHLFENVT